MLWIAYNLGQGEIHIFFFTYFNECADLPYVFIPSKEGLGSACFTKRPTSVVLIKDDSEYSSEYSKLAKKVKSLHVLPTA